jgi:predicted HD superfamily hydrolase involved in NAD metabolism
MDIEAVSKFVQGALSVPRWQHTCGVVQVAVALAKRYGIDEQRTEMAAWIHDAAREWPAEKLVAAAEHIEVPAGFGAIPILLHGPIAAELLQQKFDCDDEEMQNAVRYHTTGRTDMTTLEKILCLADAIEPGRQYPGVAELRQLAEFDLDRALATSFDNTITYLIVRHEPIFPLTVMARNDLWEKLSGGQPA